MADKRQWLRDLLVGVVKTAVEVVLAFW